MKWVTRIGALAFFGLLAAASLAAEDPAPARKPWAEVAPPTIAVLEQAGTAPGRVTLAFDLATSTDGADRAVVEMRDAKGALVDSRTLGKTKADRKSLEFEPPGSGRYSFKIIARRNDVAETKASAERFLDFVLPLAAPEPVARNLGGGRLLVEWPAVREAVSYEISRTAQGSAAPGTLLAAGPSTSRELAGFAPGEVLRLVVTALRGPERRDSAPLRRTIRALPDRVWRFTWFGQSANSAANGVDLLDADDLRLKLRSCVPKSDGGIEQKGGKFTAFHDGLSFYYTEIDAARENFRLEATFTVDFINPTPDGQEGFGIILMDRLGADGVSSVNHYTNSAGVIATKFEETLAGVKRSSKDTLGARFVTGITPEVLAGGDSAIARLGRSESHAFSYEGSALIRQGQSYRLLLVKDNSGYHASYRDLRDPEATPRVFTLYGPDKLGWPGSGKLYLGLAAARGCNVTVGDIALSTSDPAKDPPGRPEPPVLVPLALRVESPSTWSSSTYPFVLASNADGRLSVRNGRGRLLVEGARVQAGVDFTAAFDLPEDGDEYGISFTPDPSFRPGPGQAIAGWSLALDAYAEDYGTRRLDHRVYRRSYARAELYVSPNGSLFGDGSREDPLSLPIALAFSRPGQPVLLLPGEYRLGAALVVERGNDGLPGSPKSLRAAPGGRALLDFSAGGGGMQVWGDHWVLEGLDIRNTPGNVKGLQIGGSSCVLRDVTAAFCGDTGIQISGNSYDPPAKWPAGNLVIGCESHDNKDPAANNADGFAAKLTSGPGNVFRACVAYSNIDDGWDLFSKIESGPIGAVLIEGCVAYRNGSLSDGSGNGDGNGFKLGGDGISVPHILRESLAYANGASGITSNSDPSVIVERCSSFANRGANLSLYSKGGGPRDFALRGFLSLDGGASDDIREMPSLAARDNFLWDGARSLNSEGRPVVREDFVSTDATRTPTRRADGSLDLHGLMEPKATAPADVGARFGRP